MWDQITIVEEDETDLWWWNFFMPISFAILTAASEPIISSSSCVNFALARIKQVDATTNNWSIDLAKNNNDETYSVVLLVRFVVVDSGRMVERASAPVTPARAPPAPNDRERQRVYGQWKLIQRIATENVRRVELCHGTADRHPLSADPSSIRKCSCSRLHADVLGDRLVEMLAEALERTRSLTHLTIRPADAAVIRRSGGRSRT